MADVTAAEFCEWIADLTQEFARENAEAGDVPDAGEWLNVTMSAQIDPGVAAGLDKVDREYGPLAGIAARQLVSHADRWVRRLMATAAPSMD
jgi:hypothetical protein